MSPHRRHGCIGLHFNGAVDLSSSCAVIFRLLVVDNDHCHGCHGCHAYGKLLYLVRSTPWWILHGQSVPRGHMCHHRSSHRGRLACNLCHPAAFCPSDATPGEETNDDNQEHAPNGCPNDRTHCRQSPCKISASPPAQSAVHCQSKTLQSDSHIVQALMHSASS